MHVEYDDFGEYEENLEDLIDTMESIQVYTEADVDRFVELYLGGAERDRLDYRVCYQ